MSERLRVPSIDVLRGFCLFGILVINIQSFAMPHAAYLNPLVFGSLAGLDGVAWAVGRLLFDFKFLNMFAMLFGASLVLGGDATRPRRRLVWLVAFGLLHAYLVWYGDILFTYGVVGLVVVGARPWPARRLVAVGSVLLAAGPVVAATLAAAFHELPSELLRPITDHLDASSVAAELAAYRSGWLEQTPIRAMLSFESQTTGLLTETGLRAAGCMLLGMAGMRLGVFTTRKPGVAWVIALWIVGLAVTAGGMVIQVATSFAARPWLAAEAVHEVGAVPLAIAIALTVIAAARRFGDTWAVRGVATLGRTAFSAYVMQSLVGTALFGGQGLGLFGSVGRAGLFVAAALFWIFQVALANLWLRFFRSGPLEALWRGLARGDFTGFSRISRPQMEAEL